MKILRQEPAAEAKRLLQLNATLQLVELSEGWNYRYRTQLNVVDQDGVKSVNTVVHRFEELSDAQQDYNARSERGW